MTTTPPNRHHEDVALFRYGLVAQIVACPPGPERNTLLTALAEKNIPFQVPPGQSWRKERSGIGLKNMS